MNNFQIKKIFEEFTPLEICKSFLTGLIFFALLGAMFLIPVIMVSYLYVPYLEYFLLAIFIYLSLVSVYFNHLFVQTLQTYRNPLNIDFKKYQYNANIVFTAIIFITVFIIYIFMH